MTPSEEPANMNGIADVLIQLNDRLARIETALEDALPPTFRKEWYTIAETAEILGKAPFTVREWARLERVNAMKRPSGRGKASEWMISHTEIERIQNKGLLPRDL